MPRNSFQLYIFFTCTIIFLLLANFRDKKKNNELTAQLSDFNVAMNKLIISNKNLFQVETNSFLLQSLLTKKRATQNILIQDINLAFSKIEQIKGRDSLCLFFCFHENSCGICIDNEIRRLTMISDSLKIPVKCICMSSGWRFIKITEKTYDTNFEFFRIEPEKEIEELFLLPFYIFQDNQGFHYPFVPLKEQETRTFEYFKLLKRL